MGVVSLACCQVPGSEKSAAAAAAKPKESEAATRRKSEKLERKKKKELIKQVKREEEERLAAELAQAEYQQEQAALVGLSVCLCALCALLNSASLRSLLHTVLALARCQPCDVRLSSPSALWCVLCSALRPSLN
jgi:hypothetical protein